MSRLIRSSVLPGRLFLAVAGAVLVAACDPQPITPPTVSNAPSDPPAVAEAAVPLVELTISGVGTSTPTSKVRMLPATTGGPNPYGPDLRTSAAPPRPVNREILRTPFGKVLDYAPNGGWRTLARKVSAYRHSLLDRGNFAALNAPMAAGPAPSPAAITGTKKIPVIMFRFSDVGTAASHPPADYQDVLFGNPAPAGRPYSIRTFYSELSNGLVTLDGKVIGWHTLSGTEVSYTGGSNCPGKNPFGGSQCNGIFSGAAYTALLNGLNQALVANDTTDFGQYDNDGPDGIPNSGDDDGYVDLLIFVHSEQDGACGPSTNGHIWSHKGNLGPYPTNSPRYGGGSIMISSYTIQSGVGGASTCDTGGVMAIGTAAHETGHAFGLPDLYDTGGGSEGIGQWGLMGSGNYTSGQSPSRMEAWSLNELGWVTLRPLTADGTYSLGAAPISDTAFVIRPQGTNVRKEYYLIENRQGVQADSAVMKVHCDQANYEAGYPGLVFPLNCHGGLAIWHVDSTQVQAGQLPTNTLNSGPIHGLSLVQADNFRDLETRHNRGDAGDLWPGYGLNTPKIRYGADSRPRAFTNQDSSTFIGFTIDSITQLVSEGAMRFKLTFGRPLTPLAVGGGANGTIELDPLGTGAFTVGTAGNGGYNYVSATYRVRNATLGGAAYPTARSNLTFLAVATNTTLNQSNIVSLLKFDDSPSSLSAALVEPTGAAQFSGGQAVGAAADVFQAYRESELASLAPISGISSYLPYGFVARNPNHTNDRILPAAPGVGVYDGLVTFAYRVPLQGVPSEDPYKIVAKFLPVDDGQRWVTQSLQETDAASITAAGNRVNALSASIRSLSSVTLGNKAADTVCVRVAGPSGSPTHSIGTSC